MRSLNKQKIQKFESLNLRLLKLSMRWKWLQMRLLSKIGKYWKIYCVTCKQSKRRLGSWMLKMTLNFSIYRKSSNSLLAWCFRFTKFRDSHIFSTSFVQINSKINQKLNLVIFGNKSIIIRNSTKNSKINFKLLSMNRLFFLFFFAFLR